MVKPFPLTFYHPLPCYQSQAALLENHRGGQVTLERPVETSRASIASDKGRDILEELDIDSLSPAELKSQLKESFGMKIKTLVERNL